MAWEPEERFPDAGYLLRALQNACDASSRAPDEPLDEIPIDIAEPVGVPPPSLPSRSSATGEIGAPDDSKPNRAAGPLDAAPSAIVQPRSSRVVVPPRGGQVIDLSGNMPDSWMLDPNTDLLRHHRLRSIRNAAMAIGSLAAIALAIFWITSRLGDATSHNVAPRPVPEVDAAVAVAIDPPIDAPTGPTRDNIVALSHFGFFSIAATAKTQIYIDNNHIGEAPLTRLPLAPGQHSVKAVGPMGQTKTLKITIYGGQDTDEGTITW